MENNNNHGISGEGFGGAANTVNKSFSEFLHYYWYESADPYMRDKPIVNSSLTFFSILLLYLFLVLYWGPRFMEKRKPYQLKGFIRFYNLSHVLFNGYIVYDGLFILNWFGNKLWITDDKSCSFTDDPLRLHAIDLTWYGLLLKLYDLVETMIFVLRKKQSQVSFLHVYHHVTTPILLWIFMRYLTFLPCSFVPLLNCGIHVIMYIYYFLSTFGPEMQRRIRGFKRIMTIMQLTQFVMMFLYVMYVGSSNCDLPKWPCVMTLIDIVIIFYLFFEFYKKSYTKAKKN